ncbi:hypothetical protein [Sphingobium xenophagum]|uniref:hypothetical protein n=1 Tax=Sphingobium xenophagum TaxID=121428 RepID=UPI00031A7286|nr:hypothetical protein [Sphingobium xenophagum]
MFRIPSIADASAQHPPVAPQHRCAIAPTGSTNPVAVEARDGATLYDVRLDRDHWAFDPVAYRQSRLADVEARAVAAVFMAATGFAGFVLMLVAAGAR